MSDVVLPRLQWEDWRQLARMGMQDDIVSVYNTRLKVRGLPGDYRVTAEGVVDVRYRPNSAKPDANTWLPGFPVRAGLKFNPTQILTEGGKHMLLCVPLDMDMLAKRVTSVRIPLNEWAFDNLDGFPEHLFTVVQSRSDERFDEMRRRNAEKQLAAEQEVRQQVIFSQSDQWGEF